MSDFHVSSRSSWLHRAAAAAVALGLCASVLVGCPDTTPPGNVTSFAATAGDGAVVLTWANPTDSDLAGVRIQRGTGGYPDSASEGTNVYDGAAETVTDSGVVNGTLYYYVAFAYDQRANYAGGVQSTALPTAATAAAEVLDRFYEVDATLAGLTDDELPEEQRDALGERLVAAELAYRQDDPCEAVEGLEGFLSLAQTYRQGAAKAGKAVTVGVTEGLYNSGRMTRYALVHRAGDSVDCPGTERIGESAGIVLDEGGSDAGKVVASAAFGEPLLLTQEDEGAVHTEALLPGALGRTGDGFPGIPMTRQFLAVPQGAVILVDHEAHVAETVHMRLYPSVRQPVGPVGDMDEAGEADGGCWSNVVKNAAAYEKDAPFPPEPVTVTEVGTFRDLRLAMLTVAAGQWNPGTEELQLFDTVDVEVVFDGAGEYLAPAAGNPFEVGLHAMKEVVLNGAYLQAPFNPEVFEWIGGEEFMIFAHTNFMDAAETLADWKNGRGIVTRVFEVGPSDMDTSSEMVALIEDHYWNKAIRPSYILLLGDAEFIPTFLKGRCPYGSSVMATDFFYGSIRRENPETEKMEHDSILDIAVGRISVDTLAQAQAAVGNIIEYEGSPPSGSAFYQTVTVANQFDCCRDYIPGVEGVLGREWINSTLVSETVRTAFQNAGYTVERIYDETNYSKRSYNQMGYDPTPRYFSDWTALPPDIGPGSGFDWDNDGHDVTAALNEGRVIVWGDCHGGASGWASPNFNTGHISGYLSNGNKLPLIFSINCSSGHFQNEVWPSTPYDGVYFVERLWRYDDRGAIGVFAATATSYTHTNRALAWGYTDALLEHFDYQFWQTDPKARLSEIQWFGILYTYLCGVLDETELGGRPDIPFDDAVDQIWLYNLFGDPTVKIWLSCPVAVIAPTTVELTYASVGKVSLQTDLMEGMATIWRIGDDGMVPIARGLVASGEAEFDTLTPADIGANVYVSLEGPEGVVDTFQRQVGE